MSYEQDKEIKSIRERTISLKLSDADCERISMKAGENGLTVGELIENFIGDLVCGTYSNGSDERDFANRWFERCWFSFMTESSLLRHLLSDSVNIHEVDNFLTAYDELKYYEANPEEFDDEVAELEAGEKLWFEEEYHEYVDEYLKSNQDIEFEKEIDICRRWLAEFEKLQKKNDENSRDSIVENDILIEIRKKFESGYDFTRLMNEMEFIFKIPMINDPLFNERHPKVIELYRELANARNI